MKATTAVALAVAMTLGLAGTGRSAGTNYFLGFGKGAAGGSASLRQIMVDSVTNVATSYRGLRGTPFRMSWSTDDAVVNRDWLLSKLDWLAANARPRDTVVFYGHGHGGTLGMPELDVTWDELRDKLLRIPARNVVVFAMACHSGALVDSFNAVADQWNTRAAAGRSLVVLSAVNAAELAGPSKDAGIGNPFAYAVARGVKRRSGRTTDSPLDGADGYPRDPRTWDGALRFSGKVSMGELSAYTVDVTQWASGRDAYAAGTPSKHPQVTGSWVPAAVFVEPGK